VIVVVVVITAAWLFTYGMDRREMQMAANKRSETDTADFILSILTLPKRLEC
jgi:hypothetical protein